MKKLFVGILVCCMLLTSLSVFAQDRVTYSSGVKTASAVISKYPCLVTDLAVYTDGTNAVTITLYNSSTATTSGKTVLAKSVVIGASYAGGNFIPTPIVASEGVYMTLSGTGGSTIVYTTPQ
jgi:hypothetical protein